jgi:DNA polymerase I-like protein with 3'-5' exonuclease and polymerase domains
MSSPQSSGRLSERRKREKLLLLDVSSLLYRAYHALPELTSVSGEPLGALYGFLAILLRVLEDRNPSYVVAAVDLPGKTFRHETYGAYKATRPKAPDELIMQLEQTKEVLVSLGIPVLGAPRFEADDVIATVVTLVRKEHPDISIEIVSGDHDILQLVDSKTTVFAPRRGVTDLVMLTPDRVEEKLGIPPSLVTAYKALRGDPSDNVRGIAGIGPKTAALLLRSFGSLEDLLRAAAHPSEDAPRELQRFASALSEEAERLQTTEKLVTLRRDVPLTLNLSDAVFRGVRTPAFLSMLKRFGFESLLRRTAQRRLVGRRATDHGDLEAFIAAQEESVRREIDAAEASGLFSHDIAELERALIPVISAMERRGILLDVDHLRRLERSLREKQKIREEEIFRLAGHPFNLSSPKQLSDVLFSELRIGAGRKTAKGKPSTAAAVLEGLRGAHPIVAMILAWRETAKLLSTYVETLPALVDEKDARIHAKFWQLGTATGRIASSDPNLQNIPLRSDDGRAIRDAFIAGEGLVFLAADYSQIELRVAAVLAEDEAMLETFRRGDDIHEATAERIFRVSREAVTPEMRRRAKILNFGILYGMGVRRVSEEMKVSLGEAEAFLSEYFAAFPQLAAWISKVREQARSDGWTVTAFGRKRLFPELHSANEKLRSMAERSAVNAPIQGTAADVVKRGMVALAREVPSLPLVVQVHDEIIAEVARENVGNLAATFRRILEDVWPEAPIPFPVRISMGERWGSLTPL